MNVLVDSSVFIEYLKGKGNDALEVMVLNNQVLLSKVVHLELLAGSNKNQDAILLDFLSGLKQITEFAPTSLVESILLKARGRGLLGGFADLMILADVTRHKAALYTIDRKLMRLAQELSIKLFQP